MKRFAGFCLGILLILNFLDAVLTMYGVEKGLGIEQNPLMLELLKHGYFHFTIVKIALVSFGAWVLWRLIHNRWAQVGAILGTLVYAGVVCWHVWGLTL
ncbi:MAG: DUF5658 family protein [bacterium]